MSRIINFSPSLARVYDRIRQPMGVDVIAGLLEIHCRKPIQNIHLLDAGCGTGIYAKPLVEMGLGKITMLDASQEMLAVAMENLDDAIKDGTAQIVKATLPGFPFEDGTFDAVMFNMSLNHLDDTRKEENYPKTEQTLSDTHRILRHGGLLIISTILSTTIKDSIWYFQLQGGIKEKYAKTCPSVRHYMEWFDKHNFRCVSAMNLLTTSNANICPYYLSPEGPLDKEWRQALNLFDLASDSEVTEMESSLLDLKRKGELEKFIIENDYTHERGLLTIFACIAKSV